MLQSKNIYLRAIEPEDHLISHKWRNDFDLIQGYSQARYVSKETERKWALGVIEDHESGSSVRLAICTQKDSILIGFANLLNIDLHNRNCEISLILGNKKFHKKGFATEARTLLFSYGFYELGMERIWARILSTNFNAIRSSENFGYVKEVVLRKSLYKKGEFHDEFIYSMLRDEFIKKYPRETLFIINGS